MANQKAFVLEYGLHLHIYDYVLHLPEMHFKYDKDTVKRALKIVEKCVKSNDKKRRRYHCFIIQFNFLLFSIIPILKTKN